MKTFLATALASLALLAAGCSRHETAVEIGNREQILHVNLGSDPRDIDPHTVTTNADFIIVRSLFEGLTEIDPADNHPVPGVAERWETSSDGLRWTFHLRADSRWSNGDPVTAQDFVYAWHRLLSPALGAEYAHLFFSLKNAGEFYAGKIPGFDQVGVHAPEPRTLVVDLSHPVPYLPALLALPAAFPVHRATIEKVGRIDQRSSGWTRPGNFVGNGAFILAEWNPNQRVRLAKSDFYWDRSRVRLAAAVCYPIENAAVEEAAFRAGQIHVTYHPLASDKVAAYKADPARAGQLHESAKLMTKFFRFNCTKPPLDDPRVRQALGLAIDRKQLTRGVLHSDLAAFSLTPPDCAGYTADRTVRTDLPAAQRLLAEAGFPGGKGFPQLELLYYPTGDTGQPVAEVIQQMWRSGLGIGVKIIRQEMKTAMEARRTQTYQVLLSEWTGDYLDPTSFLDLFLHGSEHNKTGWESATYDRLMGEASKAPDQASRYALLRQAEALVLTEAPISPLFYLSNRVLRQQSVVGWKDNLLDLHPLKFISLTK